MAKKTPAKTLVKNIKFEPSNRSKKPCLFTVLRGRTITGGRLVLSGTHGLTKGMILINTINNTRCRVNTISNLAIKGSSVGTIRFLAAAGDLLVGVRL